MPSYTLRYSQKAKYLQLRVSAKGLEVVVPGVRRVSQTTIERFIEQKREWIIHHWKKLQGLQEKEEILPLQLPERILLRSIEQTWDVFYMATDSSKIRCLTNPCKQIKLLGNIADQPRCIRFLKQWLKKVAEEHLKEQLEQLSRQHGLFFNEITFRHTSTRWGSCSSSKNISLCCKLLFLPPHLVRHVLLHELCHTKVMSHGVRFWKLLTKLDPECDRNRLELKKAGEYVPHWAL